MPAWTDNRRPLIRLGIAKKYLDLKLTLSAKMAFGVRNIRYIRKSNTGGI